MTVACPCKIEVRWHLDSILHALISNLAKESLDSILGHVKSKLDGTGSLCKIDVRWHLASILHALISKLAKKSLDSILGAGLNPSKFEAKHLASMLAT
jgi:hypothetical protein